MKDNAGQIVFKAIVIHPMETGYRRDKKTGKKIPADFIENISVSIEGETLIEMQLGINISKNPFFAFDIMQQLSSGQQLNISWTDNYGDQVSYESVLHFDERGTHRGDSRKSGT